MPKVHPLQDASTTPAALDAARWRAVETRDETLAPPFRYGVRSTGIVCRPACPSRPARRTSVRFFDTTQEAVEAGFRACLRCRPL